MPYPAGHRERVRKKIVDSARRLFNRRGFESVSISEIMADAKMTHGGFYSYFGSKSDLYAEVLSCFFTDPEWKTHRWFAHICRASTTKTWRTHVLWWLCPQTWRGAERAQNEPLRRCFARW